MPLRTALNISTRKETPPCPRVPRAPTRRNWPARRAIRADIQSLTSTVSRIANKQVNRAQDKAMDAANQAEEAIKQNPLSAVAIAVGLGFLLGVFTRR